MPYKAKGEASQKFEEIQVYPLTQAFITQLPVLSTFRASTLRTRQSTSGRRPADFFCEICDMFWEVKECEDLRVDLGKVDWFFLCVKGRSE